MTTPTTKPPKAATTKPALTPKITKPVAAQHVAKTFSVTAQANGGQGQKIVIYGKSGIGKSTLAAMAPNAVFIDVDNGTSNLVHPETKDPIMHVTGVETFQDLRDAMAQADLFPDGATIVVDTITAVEALAEQHVLLTVKKDGNFVSSIKQYGWGDGERHVLDAMRLLLSDMDRVVRGGRNIILLAQLDQATVSNAEGTDYLEDGPKLIHRRNCSVRTSIVEWADQVFRIGYADLTVYKDNDKARAGKVDGDAERAVFTGGAQHFIAKSRPIKGTKLPPIIRFAAENDNAAWHYVFGQDCFYKGDEN
jgi:energy-coupling factor transporter ATP-binding protein EcfA2